MMPDTAVAVVTDSTATLSADLLAEHSIEVVPLQVVIGDTSYDEDTGAPPRVVAAALKQHRAVSTSRPGPEVFVDVYERLAGQGHEAIVSVHLSREVSGNLGVGPARRSAGRVPYAWSTPAWSASGTGLAAVAAARAARRGADCVAAATAASEQAAATTTLIYVDTLEHLRRGGSRGQCCSADGAPHSR
jgi:DegV family protein with EDD domain